MNQEIVLITGTSSGFGYLAALQLAAKGYFVIATMRDLTKKEFLLEAAKKRNVDQNLMIYQLDVTKSNEITAVKEMIMTQFGKLDILINNAGYCLGGLTELTSLKDWHLQLHTNVLSVVEMTQAFIPVMRQRRKGKIINIGSVSGRIGFPGMAAYSTSKFALSGFSEALRLELAPFHIHVSIIEPGSFKTNIWEKSLGQVELIDESDYQYMMNQIYKEAQLSATRADDPLKVVKVIEKICASNKPKLRYPVGKGIKNLIFFKNLLPWSWVEKIVLKRFN